MEGMLAAIPGEWKGDAFAPALTFNGPNLFHRPGVVYSVELIVAVPLRK